MALAVSAVVLPVAQADAARRAFGTRSLHIGMRGTDVRVLQDFLTKWGARTTVDGIYGPQTGSRLGMSPVAGFGIPSTCGNSAAAIPYRFAANEAPETCGL